MDIASEQRSLQDLFCQFLADNGLLQDRQYRYPRDAIELLDSSREQAKRIFTSYCPTSLSESTGRDDAEWHQYTHNVCVAFWMQKVCGS